MKASRLKQVWALVLILSLSAAAVGAATITKTNNVDALNLASSWVGATVPGESDVAQWNSTVTGDNAVSLGADLSWAGIRIANPGGAVTVGAGNTLTLGASGIDMGSATTNLTISAGLTSKLEGTLEAMIARADEMLYKAKEGGRNRTEEFAG